MLTYWPALLRTYMWHIHIFLSSCQIQMNTLTKHTRWNDLHTRFKYICTWQLIVDCKSMLWNVYLCIYSWKKDPYIGLSHKSLLIKVHKCQMHPNHYHECLRLRSWHILPMMALPLSCRGQKKPTKNI